MKFFLTWASASVLTGLLIYYLVLAPFDRAVAALPAYQPGLYPCGQCGCYDSWTGYPYSLGTN